LPLARGLRQIGHRIFAAVQDLAKAKTAFRGLDIALFQSPVRLHCASDAIEPPRTFAHVLYNCGFGDVDALCAMAGAWRTMLELINPDLMVFDHSPTALLAARGLRARKALIGTGFFCPLDEYPMADLRPWLPQASGHKDQAKQDEDRVLANANTVLAELGQPPLERLSRLFYDVDENFLVTLPELDHYAARTGTLVARVQRETQGNEEALTPCPSPEGRGETKYWGAWPNVGGQLPSWPDSAEQKRVFAYLKPFPALPRLLIQLGDLHCPTIVHGDGLDDGIIRRFQSRTMRFENRPVDLQGAGRSCDLAILNGNHGTTFSMLLAGKPTLQVPVTLEQALFSRAVERLGAAAMAPADEPQGVVAALMEMLGSDRYAEAAWRFAARYADYDPQKQIEAVLQRVEELLAT